ncbi:DUF6455 family protein [Roseibacterium sp. SDUM158017]|uniref:DUF6455 family protein n=1 Tax=Roseicyclus salinarum TaxID=3036773 RepID=UPI002415029F|nr:DUF6455 family protein [Roseibacterium sp. SDUM158017]MDG4648259.1 DUF6455 family protein [Roseibacterium sp. SDUM158017]
MQGDKTLKTHETLMDRMARTLGADLDEAELRGDLAPEERFDMLLSCTGCSDPQGCAHWLERTEAAEAAPGFCRNSTRLAELAGHE